ncbi:metal ABC transporter solute-binding protein, Zn/Mn family [Crocosphaera sp. XPORK-15E]|uniref:metal ABC transporter solute-binding protein, Zn/Mn family n=1 Tax=Crocosphaera sp. XPORK-15E TaxID=3110247 RepID=UPI002B20A04C|nr:zinc ABC transporter substrate-binding protein [Crocosphaera sp. XPORK-15E]MEA5535025.1 zinc ABC transporter substrate-binding protein [Crocosphaera sp. XPORK-15E]
MKLLPSVVIFLLLGVNLMIGCSSSQNPTSQTKPSENTTNVPNEEILNITVSVVPQEYFVKKIGGDRVKINVMVQPGTEPDNYEPKPQQLQALSQAKAYIGLGIPFETILLDKVTQTNPKLLVIDSTKGIEKLSMIPHDHHDNHTHEEPEDGEKMTLDPHVWLSPRLVKIQAKHIYETLVNLDPKNQAYYETNFNKFMGEIDQLDAKIKENLINVKQRKFIVFHPAWGYFAQEYNLTQVPIEVGGQEPSAAELGKLIKEAKKENIKIVFAQPELSSQSAKVIAKEIGGEVLLISPVAPDWSNNLLEVSKTFAKALN